MLGPRVPFLFFSESFPPLPDRLLGFVLLLVAAATVLRDWFAVPGVAPIAALLTLAFLIVALPKASASRRTFMAIGALLAIIAFSTREDAITLILGGLGQGAFIATFFIALATLRTPAATSPAIARCGEYLASQPPGKRYLALTSGGHLFSLILNYGAIQLLGGLTESITAKERDPVLREIRNRRMLLAIQRGFCASLCWSPLAFAMAISTSVVPGSSWSGAAIYAIVNAALLTFVGWALDTIVKPKFSGPRPRVVPIGNWRDLKPLLLLLLVIFAGVGLLELLTGLRIVAVVMVFVPLVATAWLYIEAREGPSPLKETGTRLATILFTEIPAYRSEMVLLVMAGIIGSLGSALAVPVIEAAGIDPSGLPPALILGSLVWIIPLLGQLGMNPILAVSLFAPLLPTPEAMGVSPAAVICAITAGWSLAGATSPFTATTMLIGRLGHTTALEVGVRWNRQFFLFAALGLTASVLLIMTLAPA